jgi:hypothetical protein
MASNEIKWRGVISDGKLKAGCPGTGSKPLSIADCAGVNRLNWGLLSSCFADVLSRE